MTNWTTGPLHALLVKALPIFVKDPFSETPRLDVPNLHKALVKTNGKSVSYETVYKWLRASRLNIRNVRMLVDLANTEANVTALSQLRRKPPKIEDFAAFYLA